MEMNFLPMHSWDDADLEYVMYHFCGEPSVPVTYRHSSLYISTGSH